MLNEKLENLLKKFKDYENNCISSNDCDKQDIDFLIQNGFFAYQDASTLCGWAYLITATYKAKNYFKEKEIYLKQRKKKIFIEICKFCIPNLIAIGALVVSIIALIKSFS